MITNTFPKIAIEIDGEQHYRPVDYFGGESKFERLQFLDNIKNEYFDKKDGYQLLRIRSEKIKNFKDFLTENLLPLIEERM